METLSVGVGNFLLLLFGCGHMEYRLKTFAEIRNEFVFPCGKASFCDQKFCESCVQPGHATLPVSVFSSVAAVSSTPNMSNSSSTGKFWVGSG